MTWPGLPVLLKVAGRPVILRGDGEAADAKRRVLERAGATVVADHPDAQLAVVAIEDEGEATAAVRELQARGVLVNAVDRPALCDFTLPAVVDRSPVLVAVMTGGVSAGLAAAIRQRLEGFLPAGLGQLAQALSAARDRLRALLPDGGQRRRAIGAALAGELHPLEDGGAERVQAWLHRLEDDPSSGRAGPREARTAHVLLVSADPDDLTLRQARWLALADRVFHAPDVPELILDRARADATRVACEAPPGEIEAGLHVWIGWA